MEPLSTDALIVAINKVMHPRGAYQGVEKTAELTALMAQVRSVLPVTKNLTSVTYKTTRGLCKLPDSVSKLGLINLPHNTPVHARQPHGIQTLLAWYLAAFGAGFKVAVERDQTVLTKELGDCALQKQGRRSAAPAGAINPTSSARTLKATLEGLPCNTEGLQGARKLAHQLARYMFAVYNQLDIVLADVQCANICVRTAWNTMNPMCTFALTTFAQMWPCWAVKDEQSPPRNFVIALSNVVFHIRKAMSQVRMRAEPMFRAFLYQFYYEAHRIQVALLRDHPALHTDALDLPAQVQDRYKHGIAMPLNVGKAFIPTDPVQTLHERDMVPGEHPFASALVVRHTQFRPPNLESFG